MPWGREDAGRDVVGSGERVVDFSCGKPSLGDLEVRDMAEDFSMMIESDMHAKPGFALMVVQKK